MTFNIAAMKTSLKIDFFNSFLGSLIRKLQKFCVEHLIVCRFKFDLGDDVLGDDALIS